jgi:hypothetical protein
MPTPKERKYYQMGFRDAMEMLRGTTATAEGPAHYLALREMETTTRGFGKPKRKLSAWNKYVKANSNKPRFRLRSGKINLKKMGVAFRKTPAGKKKRR